MEKIALKEKGQITCVAINDITHISCTGYLSTVHTVNNKMITVSKLLKDFDEELSKSGFIRVNYNTLINSKHIETVKRGEKRKITLVNKVEVGVSRRRMYIIRNLFG